MIEPDCDNCPFQKANKHKVGSRGDPKAPIAIVLESPGGQEVREGIPVVGPTGKVLFKNIPSGDDTEVFITNAMMCRPMRKEPAIMAKAAKACQGRLKSEIDEHPRKIVMAMGNSAMHSLTNDFNLKITQERGRLISSDHASIGIMPTLHPAALMRGTGSYRQFKEDCRYSFDLVKGAPRKAPKRARFIVCDTPKLAKEAIDKLITKPYLTGDIETGGFDRRHDEILCLGVGATPGTVYVFPDTIMRRHTVMNRLFKAKKPRWIWQFGKFDIAFLRRDGYHHARVDEDTGLLSYALDETGGIHDLEQIAGDLLDAPSYKNMLKPWVPKKTDSYRNVPRPVLYDYLCKDVSRTHQIFHIMRKQVRKDKKLETLYTKILIPASELLWEVEMNGIYVDDKQVNKNEDRLLGEIEAAQDQLNSIAGYDINSNSPAQLAVLLFDELRMRRIHGRSTAKDVLEKLPPHPAVKALKRHRKAAKAYSTYVVGVRRAKSDDNRVHSTFKIHGTRTGRLSSSEPNVQNIPREEALRNMFRAAKGNILIEVDLNQAELRSLATLSLDKFLCGIYNDPAAPSLHDEVAEAMFGEDFTHEEKMRAKAVNFGIVYGREAKSLAEEFDISIKAAQRMIDTWFKRCPEAYDFIKKCRRAAMNAQTITTCFGRKKRHHIVTRELLKAMMNEASNFPHQSIASDITLLAAMRIRKQLTKWGVKIINLIHDSILLECLNDKKLIDKVCRYIIKEMEAVAPEWGLVEVPFIAECKIGIRWGSLKDYVPKPEPQPQPLALAA